MERIKNLLELNDEQAQIVRSRARKIAVSAGAGTGKTRLLVARCLAELESGTSGIQSVAAITFTDNAAAELRERIRSSIGLYIRKFGERGNLTADAPDKLSTASISTIHGLAARIMRENLSDTSFPTGFETADRNEADAFLDKAVIETILKLRKNGGAASEALGDLLKNEFFNLDTVVKNIASIVRGSSEKHLPRPLERPEIKPCSVESVQKLLMENDGVFRSAGARKRFEDALGKTSAPAPAPVRCRNLKEAAEKTAGIRALKSASEEEKLAAGEISDRAKSAADWLNAQLTDSYLAVANEAAKRFSDIKIQNSVIDYEDLLENALKVLETNPAVLAGYQKLFRLIMVDEFQDTDSLQSKIINLLHGGGKGTLIVVGDKRQSIYGFRGAEPELFGEALGSPEIERFDLPTNYRTSPELLDSINGFFKNIFDDYIPMKSARNGAGAFEAFPAEGGNAEERRENEAARISEKISELAETGGFSYGDIALIFRKSGNMQTYERALRRARLPFKRAGKTKFFGLAEIRDIVSMMKLIRNPADEKAEAAVLRSPFFGISDTGLARYFSEKRKTRAESHGQFLGLLAKGAGEPSAAARYLLSIIEEKKKINFSSPVCAAQFAAYSLGYAAGALALPDGRSIRSNIAKFVEICGKLSEKGTGLAEATLFFDTRKDDRDESPAADDSDDSVTLMTCHASKGLEFPVVFLADADYSPARRQSGIAVSSKRGVMVCHNGCGFGTWKEIADEGVAEEEKRILYVAMTRAADLIFAQRYEKPRRSSFAGIMESGLETLPGLVKSGAIPPPAKKKTERSRPVPAKPCEVTGANLRPIFQREKNVETRREFCRTDKAEEGETVHRFFEIWDFSPDSVENLVEFVTAERFLPEKPIGEKIALCARNFLKSPLAEMIREALCVHREYEFVIETEGEDAKEIRGGKIDLLLETGRGTVIVDYKYTDSFAAENYAGQIDFYSRAVEKNFGAKPAERYICVLPGAELKNV